MGNNKYTDPADKGKEHRDEKAIEEKEKTLDISSLKFEDFKAVPHSAARTPHPFEGYPDRKVKIGEYMVKNKKRDLMMYLSWIVGLNPTVHVPQDPSGLRVLVGNPLRKDEKIVDIPTTHSKWVSYAGSSFDAVFDRKIDFGDGRIIMCAIVPDPISRAQIIYFWNRKTERIDVNSRYLLPDQNQKGPLRRVFQMIINPRLRLEKSIEQSFYGLSDSEAYKTADMPGISGSPE